MSAPQSTTSFSTTSLSTTSSTALRTKSTTGASSSSKTGTGTGTEHDNGLIALRYEETKPAKPPIPVTVAPPRHPPLDTHPALRHREKVEGEERKRDSGLAPTMSSRARGEEGSVKVGSGTGSEGGKQGEEGATLGVRIDFGSSIIQASAPSSPVAVGEKEGDSSSVPAALIPKNNKKSESSAGSGNGGMSMSMWKKPGSRQGRLPRTPPATSANMGSPSSQEFSPIITPIPTDSLMGEEFLDQLTFSKRGSVMFGGKKAVNGHARQNMGRRQPSFSMLVKPSFKMLSDDLEMESKKVRSMYEAPSGVDWQDGDFASMNDRLRTEQEIAAAETPEMSSGLLRPIPNSAAKRPGSSLSTRSEVGDRRPHELAGGIEDWEDVNGKDVDRYGFITISRNPSRPGTPEPRPPQRVSTALQLASETPRKKRTFGRSASTAGSRASFRRAPSRKVSTRSFKTQDTRTSKASTRSSSHLRAAANRLPGNRDRRWMDEAGDMLTLPPGLADIAEEEDGGKAVEGLKKKECERTEKWRKMAKIVKTGKDGEGMEFEFDTRNPKLVERTWKGIPDRWRAAAWYSFLGTSAKKRKDSPSQEHIIGAFHKLQSQSSADDVQIDIDVPRTINSHIMFRRRYRGGQRLLFRVLHALSLYFPNTGYVQGMASLAATLLCYYDEEKTFVMLVRMWTLRGLDKLYETGFPGLMAALDEFQKQWLDGGEVSQKLAELNIDPTAYGTRWYLTLFNYSIPFPAQLRVWDVFLLLGDPDPIPNPTNNKREEHRPFGGGLDVLHATSAALIDGTREILLDSDFENAMKVLTSWIPVKDEELLMKVAKAEWRLKRGRRKGRGCRT